MDIAEEEAVKALVVEGLVGEQQSCILFPGGKQEEQLSRAKSISYRQYSLRSASYFRTGMVLRISRYLETLHRVMDLIS